MIFGGNVPDSISFIYGITSRDARKNDAKQAG